MDAVKFLNEYNRLCNTYRHTDIKDACNDCPFFVNSIPCSLDIFERTNEIISVVEQWSKEHPVKTYRDDFLEKFPKAHTDASGDPVICRNNVYGLEDCESEIRCEDCWNMEMEL